MPVRLLRNGVAHASGGSMSFGVLCSQKDCKNYAALKYTWPGRDQAAICAEHAPKLKATANALGLHLQLLPVTVEDHERTALSNSPHQETK